MLDFLLVLQVKVISFLENLRPLYIDCEEDQWIAAARWALSDDGERIWRHSGTDVIIVDPSGHFRLDDLLRELRKPGFGWDPEDVLTGPIQQAGHTNTKSNPEVFTSSVTW